MGLGLPWQSSGFRLCASNAGGREFDPWLENWNPDALWCRQKKKKKDRPKLELLPMAGGIVKWNDHFGKQNGSSLKC